jgi:2-isopropylmalate synthase
MLSHPATRYAPFVPVDLPDRQWPSRSITAPPVWLSTDLRDGNQALFDPMGMDRKLEFFELLLEVGFKEIEVAFPASSDIEFRFVRKLIEEGRIPEDVTIEVMTQARPHLIERTIESVAGARRAIVHLYNATAPNFRRIVFGLDKAGVKDIAVQSTRHIRALTARYPKTDWIFQYSPETFTATELDFAKEICDAVSEAWQPTPERKMIVNLPATVEIGTPNFYADQIEWMHRHLARRDSLVLSVHPHNDRGTAVGAAELALMAGAERVEGCLFGNGERTGNVDLVTIAMNLYSQGIHPGLDFSRINDAARVVERCNQLPIHPRHPYVGDLVFTAFSGSHQDAIKKGMEAQKDDAMWEVPYLPIDPRDVGRTYDSIIRVNSQSGKGGIAYLLERDHGVVVPRRMQVEFSGTVQQLTESSGAEVSSAEIWSLFQNTYMSAGVALYRSHRLADASQGQRIELEIDDGSQRRQLTGTGNGPIDAVTRALDPDLRIAGYEERSLGGGANASAMAIIEASDARTGRTTFGAGVHENIITASVLAVLSAWQRLNADGVSSEAKRPETAFRQAMTGSSVS